MGLFRADRRRADRPDVWLPLKVALFVVGALAAVIGMGTGQDWLVNAAIVALLLGVLLRFWRR